MELNLEGKIALVTGSSRGIGETIAEVLLKEGCTVFINGREMGTLRKTMREFKARNKEKDIYAICGDLTVTDNIKKALNEILVKAGKPPDIVVANIGSGSSISGWDVTDEEWLRMFNLNLFGTVRLCRESIKVMKDKTKGNIVCISSIAACESISAPLPYSTAKAALTSFVKAVADITAQYGIRINAVSPGNVFFKGGTWDKKMKENKGRILKYINNNVPLKKFASPYDIAHMVAFLVSDKAKFITGANFIVDGGQVRRYL